jgi:hypothetical protein
LAPDESQPVEPLLIRQSYGFAALAHCWPSNDPQKLSNVEIQMAQSTDRHGMRPVRP